MRRPSWAIWSLAIHRPQFMLVLLALACALGAYAVLMIPRQEDPSFYNPSVDITVVYPGADPADIERLAVDPIEDALVELDNVKELRSTSENGVAELMVEFAWGEDPLRRYDEVVREVNALRPQLPADITEIRFRRFNPNLVNIAQFAITAPAATPLELKNLAEDLEELIETVPGIRRADISGIPLPEVTVTLDLARLAELGLAPADLLAKIRSDGVAVPGGAVESGGRRFNLTTSGDFASLDSIGATVLRASNGNVLRLSDVAMITWGTETPLVQARYNGVRAAFVSASMQDGMNIFDVQASIAAKVADFSKRLPSGVAVVQGFDQARNVDERLTRLLLDFAIALGLVLLTLAPLGFRASSVVVVAIPLSLSLGVAAMWMLGYSINQISVAGFILSLGLLVDDAIVVIENIARHLRGGASRTEAAIRGTGEIALAVLGCTFALLFAFLPLLNLPEAAGEFLRGLPLAVVLTIVASLLVALTVVPFLASRVLSRNEPEHGNRLLQWLRRAIHRLYRPLMRGALLAPKRTLVIAGVLVIASLTLLPALGFTLFPIADKPQFTVSIRAPEDASLASTDRALRFVEHTLKEMPQMTQRMSTLGAGNPWIYYNMDPLPDNPSVAEVFVSMDAWRGQTSQVLLDFLQKRLATYTDAHIQVKQFKNGPPVEAPIEVRILGPELSTLKALSAEVSRRIATVKGTHDVINPLRVPRLDLALNYDVAKAGLVGVGPNQFDATVRMALAGVQAATYRDGRGDPYPVVLRMPSAELPQLHDLERIWFQNERDGSKVPFAQIASPQLEAGPTRIERYMRERMVIVTAQIDSGLPMDGVSNAVYTELAKMPLPAGYRLYAGGEAEATKSSIGGLGTASLIALFGIVAILVLEFGNFRSTLIVLGVIPFGIGGAIAALWIAGYPLSYTAILGFVALVGVEIKNSILLVDFTNAARRTGMPLLQAIEHAGEERFLPVLLTSITAIGGLLPLATSGSGLYAPMAIVMIGGLLASTLLARIVTPVMYLLLPPTVDMR
ncbi:efflux RND transporter permease subunit [Xanthomonas euroxanthea]|uniref:efflux RND transporter permease subunit n=1 Tax=Xanthomonas euroxanthea TaxID=2259622 RepID=UPI000CEF4CC2|nr:efflux RND transporter permease subunit [Xanthomonas euroxanthea]PPT32466.1 multidrug transporter AcrB [Xanthomonas arboricola]